MRALVAVFLAMLLASAASAQTPEKPNEFFVSIGDAGLIFEFEDALLTIGTLGYVTYEDEELGFQIAAGYQRWLNRWGSLGVTGSWAGSKRTMVISGTPRGDVERRLLTAMVDARGHWYRRPSVDLYSGLALGGAHLSDDLEEVGDEDSVSGFAFHVIPIGIRAGRDWGASFELGIGWHGFIKAGLSRRW